MIEAKSGSDEQDEYHMKVERKAIQKHVNPKARIDKVSKPQPQNGNVVKMENKKPSEVHATAASCF